MDEEELISAAMKALAAKRKPTQKTCARCGTRFSGLHRARYCSNACKVAAYRARKKDEK